MPPKKKDGKGKSKSKSKKKVTDNSESNEENERLELLQKATSLEGDIVKEGDLSEQFWRQSELLKQYWEIEKKTREVSSKKRFVTHLRSGSFVSILMYPICSTWSSLCNDVTSRRENTHSSKKNIVSKKSKTNTS